MCSLCLADGKLSTELERADTVTAEPPCSLDSRSTTVTHKSSHKVVSLQRKIIISSL